MIPSGAIFIWSGTNASIPAGWVRETTLDSKYPKGTALNVDPAVAGGATTHQHSSVSNHTHSTDAHVHSLSYGGSSGSIVDSSTGNGGARNGHVHSTQNSGAITGDSIQSSISTYSSIVNDPPYHEVIFIKPTDAENGLADNGICFVDTSSTLGFTFCDGSNSTPDLRNKYLKGAATGGNAGGIGGSLTNVHNLTHTHTTSHNHGGVTTDRASSFNQSTSGVADMANDSHTHTTSITAVTPTTSDTPSLTTSETVEPAYSKIIPVQNKTGNTLESVGMIGMWLGTLADIPTGWSELPSMREMHLKCANTTNEYGSFGGSNTHTHTSQYHTHTLTSHNHSASTSAFDHNTRHSGNSAGGVADHTHAVSVSSVANTLGNGSSAASSSSNEPAYLTVAFIKITNIISGGSFFFKII